MKYLILLAMLLAGCSGGGSESTETTVVIETEPLQCRSIYYGDSIGRQLSLSIYAPDFDYDVLGGRKITDIDYLDDSYCTIYLALGTNEDKAGPEVEEMHLISLIVGIEDKVICVLPMAKHGLYGYMRGMMKEHCWNIIDPAQQGIYPLNPDDVHLEWGKDNDNVRDYAALFPDY